MDNSFNPFIPMQQGQQVAHGFSQAQLEGVAMRERLALKKAAGQLGSQNYFAGYEGVPGAERPDSIKDVWMNGDPDQAMKLEDYASQRFKLERGAEIAGKIEAAKKAADLEYGKNMMREFYGSEGGQQANAMGSMLGAPMSQAPGSGVLAPTQAVPSATERTFEITPQGPKFGVKRMSDFEQSMKTNEDEVRRTKEAREASQTITENIRRVTDQIKSVQEGMQARSVPWGEGQQTVAALRGELEGFRQQRDSALRGPSASMTMPQPAPSSPPARPIATPAPTPSPAAPEFTEKEQGAMNVKNREEQMTAANKEIANARLGVEKVTKFLPQMKELHQLVTTQDIGHPELDSVYGAGTVLSLKRSNAQVKKLNEAIINMFAEPGQSQMMNTIVERQMQGAVVPGLFTEPQLNKVNSAILLSNVEHLRNLPTFLEQWQAKHNGSLTGATDAWVDYTDHNRRYTYAKDARGTVAVAENKKVMTPETWQSLRDQNKVRAIGDNTFVQQKDGSWMKQP